MSELKVSPTKTDHRIGSLENSIVIVEYGDFECPYCAKAAPELERVVDEFGSKICYIYRHFPLREMHPHAEIAALAAEAADQQGQFWNMQHELFKNQRGLSLESVTKIAEELQLNLSEFKKDLKRQDLLERINDDFIGGIRGGVNGTPTLFLNGYRFDAPPQYEYLKSAIQQFTTGSVSIP
jgi:protein-disulfide isomerase